MKSREAPVLGRILDPPAALVSSIPREPAYAGAAACTRPKAVCNRSNVRAISVRTSYSPAHHVKERSDLSVPRNGAAVLRGFIVAPTWRAKALALDCF